MSTWWWAFRSMNYLWDTTRTRAGEFLMVFLDGFTDPQKWVLNPLASKMTFGSDFVWFKWKRGGACFQKTYIWLEHKADVLELLVWSFEGCLWELRWGNKKTSTAKFNTHKYYRTSVKHHFSRWTWTGWTHGICLQAWSDFSHPMGDSMENTKTAVPYVNPRPSCVWSYLVVLRKCGTLAPGLGKPGKGNLAIWVSAS